MYDINILVNGTRCKKYTHEGNIFIEAKNGSEYSIEVRNNNWLRKLVICSVDGLDIISGNPADYDSPGYVLNPYTSSKFDGFRVSGDTVAKFVFCTKNKSYAANKDDDVSIKNVGIIGVRIFNENIKTPIQISNKTTYTKRIPPFVTYTPYDIYGSIKDTGTYDTTYTCCNDTNSQTYNSYQPICKNDNDDKSLNRKYKSKSITKGFDMGTDWGKSKQSKAIDIEFEKGSLDYSYDIYYASRESLIEMGIPISNEKQIAFPKSFSESKYATPPKNWKG